MPVATNWTVEMKLAAGTLCMQTLLTSSSVLLQTENVNIAQSEFHEYDSMAAGPRGCHGRRRAAVSSRSSEAAQRGVRRVRARV